jgi:outer membrane protein OmpA-like peptidoglycan-associated protein
MEQQEVHHTHSNPGFGQNSSGLGVFIIALLAVVIIVGAWWLWNNDQTEMEYYRLNNAGETAHTDHDNTDHSEAAFVVSDPGKLGKIDALTGNFIYEVGNLVKITLPDAAKTVLEVGINSTEAKLFRFLGDAATQVDTVDKTKGWITCDRIFFKTGEANLTDSSKRQIANLASILKAFPGAELKVGGYTDNTGSEETNMQVSGERAATVASAIQATGVKNNLKSEGYGPMHPLASNDTKEGQALNRRVDVRVTRK